MERMAHFCVKMIYNHPIGVMNGMKLFIKHLNLSKKKHRYAIADIMQELGNKNLDAEFEAFGNGFLYTCRRVSRVMSRLRQNKAFEKYANISNNCWYLVTEIDADTEEEERLLEEVYQEIISTLTT